MAITYVSLGLQYTVNDFLEDYTALPIKKDGRKCLLFSPSADKYAITFPKIIPSQYAGHDIIARFYYLVGDASSNVIALKASLKLEDPAGVQDHTFATVVTDDHVLQLGNSIDIQVISLSFTMPVVAVGTVLTLKLERIGTDPLDTDPINNLYLLGAEIQEIVP